MVAGPSPAAAATTKAVLVGRLVSEPGIGFEVMKERFLGDDVVTRFLPVLRCVACVPLLGLMSYTRNKNDCFSKQKLRLQTQAHIMPHKAQGPKSA